MMRLIIILIIAAIAFFGYNRYMDSQNSGMADTATETMSTETMSDDAVSPDGASEDATSEEASSE